MSRFRFRLEAVRKLKKANEDERAGELAEAISEAGAADQEREALAALEDAGRAQMSELEGDIGRQKSVAVMMEHLAEHREAARRRLQEANGKVRERQDAFREAITERRAIDRLRDRQQREWDINARRREQKATDEVNSTRHGGSESGSGASGQES